MLKNIIFSITKQAIEDKEVLLQFISCAQYLEDQGYNIKLVEAGEESYPKIKAAGKKTTLIICDSSEDAKTLSTKGYYCVGALHDLNKDEKFEGLKYIFAEIDQVDEDSFVKVYQRYAGEPWEVIRTERLLIRESTVEDVDEFYRLYKEPEMTRYLEGLFENPEDEKRYQKDYIEKVYGLMGFGIWTLVRAEDGEVIGRAGYSIRNGFENIELGFLVGKAYQGQGYAYEACDAILRYGKEYLGLEAVQALVKKENVVSIKLCEKLGFTRNGSATVEENIYGHEYPGADNSDEESSDSRQVKVNKPKFVEYVRFDKIL